LKNMHSQLQIWTLKQLRQAKRKRFLPPRHGRNGSTCSQLFVRNDGRLTPDQTLLLKSALDIGAAISRV
jgi:hypothetical protein